MMLDVDQLKWSGASTAAAAACLLADVEDTMEDAMAMEDAAMLFDLDDDWLHEHNLDVLFDLFEEELEGSLPKVEPSTAALHQFSVEQQLGSSPITSYLFGSSASSLASALDLYELLYLDAASQQPSTSTPPPPQQQQQASSNAPPVHPTTLVSSNVKPITTSGATKTRHQAPSGSRSSSSSSSRQSTGSSGTNSLNVMRIKRRLRRGQSEGVSLLARRPGAALVHDNTTTTSRNNNIKTSDKNSSNTTSITNSSSKKLSSSTTSSSSTSNGIDISNKSKQRNRHLYHYHQHLHYITACSVIKEHAYAAVRHPTIQIN